jgi:hypothetical protein
MTDAVLDDKTIAPYSVRMSRISKRILDAKESSILTPT